MLKILNIVNSWYIKKVILKYMCYDEKINLLKLGKN